MKKLYIVRKYIMATSAKDAIKKDKTAPVDDVWADENWLRETSDKASGNVGFNKRKKK